MAEAPRDHRPGIRRLARLLRAHCEAIEADLAVRGIDLRDLWRPGSVLTWRRLAALIRHLPPESATMTALRNSAPAEVLARQAEQVDPATLAWSRAEMLAASQLDAINQLIHMYASAHSKQPVARPKPTPRPGVVAGARRRRTPPEQRALIDPRMRAKPPE